MPHIQVIQAIEVIKNHDDYPEVIVAYAKAIVEWSDSKRFSMQWLWSNRALLHFWIAAKEGNSPTERRRNASRKLMRKISKEDLSHFYKAIKHLDDSKTAMGMTFCVFDALVKTLRCKDIALMHRYFSCVNAKRTDPTLEAVGFLRWANGAAASEIISWRMLKA